MKKRIVSIFLAAVLLLLTPVTVFAEGDPANAPAKYYQTDIFFVDPINYVQKITPTFMVPADKSTVYVKAEDILEFLNANFFEFKSEQTYKQFAIASQVLNYVVMYDFNSKNVTMYVSGSKIEYKAPDEALFKDGVAWLPFEFTMNLFNIDYNVDEGTFKLSKPQYTALMVIAAICGNTDYNFSWTDEVCISMLNAVGMSAGASVLSSFSGLITGNGAAWIDLVTFNVMNKTEEQYAEKIATLFTSPSTKEAETLSDRDGYLLYDKIATFLTRGTNVVSGIDVDILTYAAESIAKLSPNLSDDCDRLSKFFTKNSEAVEKIANGADTANDVCDNVSKYFKLLVNLLSFWQSIENKSETASYVLVKYASNKNVKHSYNLKKFATMTQDDSLQILIEFMEDNLIDIAASSHPTIDGVRFYVDIAWDIAKGVIPGFDENLDSADSYKLSELGIYYQNDAKSFVNKYKNQTLVADSVNQSNFEDLADYAYAYLKFSLISRDAACKAIEKMPNVTAAGKETFRKHTDRINKDIGFYLEVIESATPNEANGGIANYGYLPSDVSGTEWIYEDIISYLEQNAKELEDVKQALGIHDEFTRTPGDGTISEEEAIKMVQKRMAGVAADLVFGQLLKDYYTFDVYATKFVDSKSIYAYIVVMGMEGTRDEYCLFVPVDGAEMWIGWRQDENTFCCYTDIDMKNVSATELITKMDELYQKGLEGQDIPLDIIKINE